MKPGTPVAAPEHSALFHRRLRSETFPAGAAAGSLSSPEVPAHDTGRQFVVECPFFGCAHYHGRGAVAPEVATPYERKHAKLGPPIGQSELYGARTPHCRNLLPPDDYILVPERS